MITWNYIFLLGLSACSIYNHIHSKYPLGSRVLRSEDTAASTVSKDLSPLKAPVLSCYPYSSLNSREKTHSLPCEQPITSAPNNAVTQRKHTHTHQLTEQNSHLLPWRHHYKLFYLRKFKVEPRMPNMSPKSSLKKPVPNPRPGCPNFQL